MTVDRNTLGAQPILEDGKLAAALAAWRLFLKSFDRADDLQLREVFQLLWLHLDAAAEEGHVAVIVEPTDDAPTADALIAAWAQNTAKQGGAATACVVNQHEYEALCRSGVVTSIGAITNIDVFKRFVPFVREPLAGRRERLYFTRRFREEFHVADAIADRLVQTATLEAIPGRLEELLAMEDKNPYRNAEQIKAVINAVHAPFSVITGGPGTGKTTSVANLLSVFLSPDPEVKRPVIALAAQTGKAAARMMESLAASASDKNATGARRTFLQPLAQELADGRIQAKTIDRWLVTPTQNGAGPSKDNPLDAELLVLDEASMIDLTLAYRLLSVLAPSTRVILLGDANQLAAVGPGAVFAELCAARIPEGMPPMVSRLRKSWRFPAESAIGRISDAICRGDADALLGADSAYLSGILQHGHPIEADTLESLEAERATREIQADALVLKNKGTHRTEPPREITEWLTGRLTAYMAAIGQLFKAQLAGGNCDSASPTWRQTAKALRNFRFLCATKKGSMGVENINQFAVATVLNALHEDQWGNSKAAKTFAKSVHRAIKARLNNDRTPSLALNSVAFPGEVIMVTQNDAGAEVFNGDVAVVLPDAHGEPCMARLLESGRDVPLVLLPAYETAFAMTIHKSQGSEFGTVGVFMPDDADSPLAARELLYTGVTRAKERVRIFSTLAVLRKAVLTAANRTSGLGDKLTLRVKIKNLSR